tara:strand:- start:57 stop:296 length:240 start_codon:yes stop_codon:yes gene_type:complete
MSKEELNQELSTDDLKDISGGSQMGELRSDHVGAFRGNNLADKAKWANRLTTKGKFNKSRNGKKFVDTNTGIVHLEDDA